MSKADRESHPKTTTPDQRMNWVTEKFARRLTPHTEELTRKSPAVAKQYEPDVRELIITPGENEDPIGDHPHSPVKGIVHRHKDRVLFKITNACAVNCRFCFRKEMLGKADQALSEDDIETAIDYIESHPEIWEVILTGGDPLVLSPRRLHMVLDRLEAIEHVHVLRIHSRIPIAAPDMVTDELAAAMKRDKALYIAIHINHADEITPAVETTLKTLRQTGVVLISQSVLLKGINDNIESLETLFRKLVSLSVKPYYLHHADMTPGTSHFRTTIDEGLELTRALLVKLSGLCQPVYVLDIPGGYGKVPAHYKWVTMHDDGYTAEDHAGDFHRFKE